MGLPPHQDSPLGDAPPSIRMVETSPNEIVFHRIEDHQLEYLTNISRPLTLAGAGAAVGAFFSLTPAAVEALGKVGTANLTIGGMIYCLASTVALILSIVFSISAYNGEIKSREVLKTIRSREQRQI